MSEEIVISLALTHHIPLQSPSIMSPPFRTDIQALRAIAVLLVVGFHVWPSHLTGGYVGVDVFFVISGYLITGHLLREVASTGRIDLPTFYARRARRLLPAASLTLVAVGVAAYLWMPPSTWPTTAADMAASTLYAENWALVRRSVDYLAQDQAPSPLQHFWSLSVEEQFYLGWPLLVAWGGRRGRRSGGSGGGCSGGGGGSGSGRLPANAVAARAAHAWAMVAVCAVSFMASLYYARADPAPGYFLTATRLWEMGVGGLVALWAASPWTYPPKPPQMGHQHQGLASPPPALTGSSAAALLTAWPAWARAAGTAGGLAAILGCGALYTPQIPFPGSAALVPVLGAAAFIAAGEVGDETGVDGGVGGGAGGPGGVLNAIARVLAHPALQYVGDLSYSLYLAHWPVVVLYPYMAGRPVEEAGLVGGGRIVLVAWALAHACKRGWEDRFRQAGGGGAAGADNRQALPCATADVEVWLPELVGHDHGAAAAAAAAAAATKKHLAQAALKPGPPRSAAARSRSLASAAWMAGMLAVATLVTAGSLGAVAPRHAPGGADDGASGATMATSPSSSSHPGAELVVADTARQTSDPPPPVLPLTHVIPALDAAAKDAGPAYTADGHALCIAGIPDTEVKVCEAPGGAGGGGAGGQQPVGRDDATAPADQPLIGRGGGSDDPPSAATVAADPTPLTKHVVILGDSHAAHWLPALYELTRTQGWRVTGLTKGSCPPSAVMMSYSKPGAPGRSYTECRDWLAKAVAWIAEERPDAVLVAASRTRYRLPKTTAAETASALADGMVDVVHQVTGAGIPVVAIKHAPSPGKDIPLCLATVAARGGAQADATGACAYEADKALAAGWIELAAQREPALHLLSLDDAFCDAGTGTCPPIIGNVVVLRDTSHMTASFSRTLAPALGRRLVAALPGLEQAA